MGTSRRQRKVASTVATLPLPPHITLHAWDEVDFPAVQRLSTLEGWTTPTERPREALVTWQHSWPALVARHKETVIGFSRAVSDGLVTTYIADVLVAAGWRRPPHNANSNAPAKTGNAAYHEDRKWQKEERI